jgi:hypothetical protein
MGDRGLEPLTSCVSIGRLRLSQVLLCLLVTNRFLQSQLSTDSIISRVFAWFAVVLVPWHRFMR